MIASTAFGGSTATPAPVQPHPLTTAMAYTGLEGIAHSASDENLALQRIRDAGATAFRITLDWASVAPAKKPSKFDASDPDDPAYNWSSFDAQLEQLERAGLQPLVAIWDAPTWARQSGTGQSAAPKISAWKAFATAAAERYSGRDAKLPAVRYWIAWLEPNLTPTLSPQLVHRHPYAPIVYRSMVNALWTAVHRASSLDRVVAGGLAPFRDVTPSVLKQNSDWGPLSFMRSLFCLSSSLKKTCSDPVHFDIWALHPYTSGGPGHKAVLPNDISLGDFDKLWKTLDAARSAGNLVAPHGLRVWVTEFSWDSNPPDPYAVPTRLLERWVPQALYEMWENGVSLVTWLTLEDQALKSGPYQAGFYYFRKSFASARAKPYLEGFRFPFVAFPGGATTDTGASGTTIWGRTPNSKPGVVTITWSRTETGPWQTIGSVTADRYGIFRATLPDHVPTGYDRATVGTESSLPFGLKAVPDRSFNPFGGPTSLEPVKKK